MHPDPRMRICVGRHWRVVWDVGSGVLHVERALDILTSQNLLTPFIA